MLEQRPSARLPLGPVDSNTKGTESGHSVLAYVLVLVRSMNDAVAPLVVAEDTVEVMARLEVGSTIETSGTASR